MSELRVWAFGSTLDAWDICVSENKLYMIIKKSKIVSVIHKYWKISIVNYVFNDQLTICQKSNIDARLSIF